MRPETAYQAPAGLLLWYLADPARPRRVGTVVKGWRKHFAVHGVDPAETDRLAAYINRAA